MPRQRIVKPDFWSSPQITRLSHGARCCFIGLWNFCDDGGRHRASVARLRMEVFPADPLTDAEVASFVEELKGSFGDDGRPLLIEYEVDGLAYWEVTGWHHQYILHPRFLHPSPQGNVPNSKNVLRTFSPINGTERNGTERIEPSVVVDDERTETKRCNPVAEPGTSEHPISWDEVYEAWFKPAVVATCREPNRMGAVLRETLMKAAYLAAAKYGRDWLLEACKLTRREAKTNPPNFLKGVLAKKLGMEISELFDRVRVPPEFLKPRLRSEKR